MALTVNIISKSNGVGLDQDVDLLCRVLEEAGFKTYRTKHTRFSSLWRFFERSKKFDVNIFIERAHTRWCGLAKASVLIPNQERFPMRLVGKLKKIDAVLVKSRHAEEIFSKYHDNVCFIGFSSRDLGQKTASEKARKFFHLAGKSTMKGTEEIIRLWQKHPEWPDLTLVKFSPPEQALPSNIRLISGRASDEQLKLAFNEHYFHLCPSRSEGWGHYIVEAMACGAVVITTDAPPMSELVDESRGLLVAVSDVKPRHLGFEYYVDEVSLEQKIQEAIDASDEVLGRYQIGSREWYENNNREFARRLIEALKNFAS